IKTNTWYVADDIPMSFSDPPPEVDEYRLLVRADRSSYLIRVRNYDAPEKVLISTDEGLVPMIVRRSVGRSTGSREFWVEPEGR
ncbi:hypothetical protein LCGC14_3158950, partial [marine sediment metagenome]